MSDKILPKPVKERDNIDLLELVCQLYVRAYHFPSKDMHDAYIEARTELEIRLTQSPVPDKVDEAANVMFYQTVPDSHFWTDIDMMIRFLNYQIRNQNAPDIIDYLITGLENCKKNGYSISKAWQSTQQSDAVEETNELALEAMDFYWRALTDKLNGKDLGDIERKNYEVLTAKLYKLLKQ